MKETKENRLRDCTLDSNCTLVEWKFYNYNKAFKRLVEIAKLLPRTTIIKETETYWHGVCRSLIFRFPDDLQILKIADQGLIQIKSSSRYGASDLGVNRNRINTIYKELTKDNEFHINI